MDNNIQGTMSKPSYKDLENKILELKDQLNFITQIDKPEDIISDDYDFNSANALLTTFEVLDHGQTFIIKDISPIGEESLGFDKSVLIGKNISDVFPEIKDTNLVAIFKKVWKTGISEFALIDKHENNHITKWKEILVHKLPNGHILSFCNDITEKMNLTKQLRFNESLYRNSIKEAPVGIISFTSDGYPIISNQSALEILGISNDVNQNLSIIDVQRLRKIGFIRDFLKCLKSKQIIRNETVFKIEEDRTIYIKYALKPLLNNDGTIYSIQAFFEDSTYNTAKEKELQLSENNLRTLFNTMDDFVAEIDYDGVFLYIAPTNANFFKNPKLVINKKIHDIFDPQVADILLEFIRESIDSNKMMTIEYPLTINNEKVYFDGKAIKKTDNSVFYIARDITKHKKTYNRLMKAKNKAEKSENEFKSITENAYEGITVADTLGNYTFVNPAFCKMTGYSQEELLNMKVFELAGSNERQVIDEKLFNKSIEYVLKRKDGSEFTSLLTISLMQIGIKVSLLGVVNDITKLKQYEKNLIKAKEEAEQSDRLKSIFLSNMSHEIRTPMNGILGFTSLLKEPDLEPEETAQYIAVIERSGFRLLNIINDLIDISKIESGLMDIRISNFSVNMQLEYLHTFFQPEAINKQLTLTNDPHIQDYQIATDKEKFIAILTNLLKNAIKYSNHGTINFGYSAKGNILTFYIKDEGIGIEKTKIKSIFDRFVQADNTLASSYEGAGLGLSISQAFVELLGGRIWLESEINKGSQFYFTLPISNES